MISDFVSNMMNWIQFSKFLNSKTLIVNQTQNNMSDLQFLLEEWKWYFQQQTA